MKSKLKKMFFRYRIHTPPPTFKILYDGVDVELKREGHGLYSFRYLETFKQTEPLTCGPKRHPQSSVLAGMLAISHAGPLWPAVYCSCLPMVTNG
jgi:hypothetical protein